MIKALLPAVIVPVALIHGYLYLQYGTGHPCPAAAKVLFDAGRFDLLAKMSTSPIECYQTALLGVEARPKIVPFDEGRTYDPGPRFKDRFDKKREP
jgi:hypothetical protein